MPKAKKKTAQPADTSTDDTPKSMVILTSPAETGRSLAQLTKDTRMMMGPHTAARLRERKNNRLRDYTTMAGPLGVTHLLLLHQSGGGPTLRIAKTPRGPTLFFRIKEYSLNRDLSKVVRNPRSQGPEFKFPPLLVMNNFSTTSSKTNPEEELLRTTFQNLFPALNTSTATTGSMRRVILLYRNTNEPGSDIELRHYAISIRPVDNRRLRKLKKVPDLSRLSDVSDFMLGGDSASESEVEEDSKIEIGHAQRGVKLSEIGPRLTLSLYKVTDGVSEGKVIYHRDIRLSDAQKQAMDEKHDKMRALKEQRKAVQLANVKRKLAESEGKMSRSKRGKLRALEIEDGYEMSAGELDEEERLIDESDNTV